MLCPYCGIEMEHGWLQSSRQIIWSHEKKDSLFLAEEVSGDLKVSKGLWKGSYKEAHFCTHCKKLIIDIDPLV